MGANRTSIAPGTLLAIVFEYDGGGRLGADSFALKGLDATANTTRPTGSADQITKTAGAWNNPATIYPNIVLNASDGSYGTLVGAFVCSNLSTLAFNLNTAAQDEVAMEFSLPFPVTVEELGGLIQIVNGSTDFNILLYSGTTSLASLSVDGNTGGTSTGETRPHNFPITPQNLIANTPYKIAVQPSTANNVTVSYFDVNTANHMKLHGSTAFHWWDRVDTGAWGHETTTRCPLFWFGASSFDDGVGGGAAPILFVGA